MAAEIKIRTCLKCATELPIERFSKVGSRKNKHGTEIIYYRHECKACMSKVVQKYPLPSFDKVLRDTDRVALLANKDHFGIESSGYFHKRCNLSMNVSAFRKYVKNGDVNRFLNPEPIEMKKE